MMLPTEPAVDTTATAAQVWHRLGAAIEAARLPAPTAIDVHPTYRKATVWLQEHDRTDLYTWVAWLTAGRSWEQSRPGRAVTAWTARWCGWKVDVVLFEADTAADTGRAA